VRISKRSQQLAETDATLSLFSEEAKLASSDVLRPADIQQVSKPITIETNPTNP
jgi:hypothetical protein